MVYVCSGIESTLKHLIQSGLIQSRAERSAKSFHSSLRKWFLSVWRAAFAPKVPHPATLLISFLLCNNEKHFLSTGLNMWWLFCGLYAKENGEPWPPMVRMPEHITTTHIHGAAAARAPPVREGKPWSLWRIAAPNSLNLTASSLCLSILHSPCFQPRFYIRLASALRNADSASRCAAKRRNSAKLT